MRVTLLGAGCGGKDTMTVQGLSALDQADFVAGAGRLLTDLPLPDGVPTGQATKPEELLRLLLDSGSQRPCVVYSGDTGLFSGAKNLLPLLKERGIEVQVLPGISSLQYFAARLGKSWQDWGIYSAHGVSCDPVAAVCAGRPAFFLTGGTQGPAELCRTLSRAGLGGLEAWVGENLSLPQERVTYGTAGQMAHEQFAPLSVLLVYPVPDRPRRVPGIPDEAFLRGKTPMTKQEARAAVLAKLAVGPEDVCWDIGAGTGSVSVELALQCKEVWSVERDAAACGLILANRGRFGAWNLHLVQGEAPDALAGLPAPDAVFVGGSGGQLNAVLQAVHGAGPRARVCVSAISLETLSAGFQTLSDLGYDVEVTQLSVSRAKSVGELHLLLAQNPVFLLVGTPR